MSSLERGLDLLEALLNARQPLGVTELSRLTEQSKSTVHRALTVLVQHGFARQRPDSRYELGMRLAALSGQGSGLPAWHEIALPHLEWLRDESGETSHLGVGISNEVIYVEKKESRQSLRMSSAVGWRNPLYCTALGKAILSVAPEAFRERYLASTTLAPRTEHTITDIDELVLDLGLTRARGFSIDEQELELGLRCIGSPVFDVSGSVVGAVSISGPISRVDADTLGPLVLEAATRISQTIGFRADGAMVTGSAE